MMTHMEQQNDELKKDIKSLKKSKTVFIVLVSLLGLWKCLCLSKNSSNPTIIHKRLNFSHRLSVSSRATISRQFSGHSSPRLLFPTAVI